MKEAKLINPLALAYLGDSIYEIEVRKHIMEKGIENPNKLQKIAVKFVSAAPQEKIVKHLMNTYLTEDEIKIVKRGRNAKSGTRKNIDMQTYRYATAFECLIGHLYLEGNNERCVELIRIGIDLLEEELNEDLR